MFEYNTLPNMIVEANYNLFNFIFNILIVLVVSQVRGGPV